MFCFTMVNRPENLAEGAGADRQLLVFCKEGSGQIMPTHTVLRGINMITRRHSQDEEEL